MGYTLALLAVATITVATSYFSVGAQQTTDVFTRATLCYGPVSVCLSVCQSQDVIVSKLLELAFGILPSS